MNCLAVQRRIKHALQLPQIQMLWQNTEIQLDFGGLEERNDIHGANI